MYVIHIARKGKQFGGYTEILLLKGTKKWTQLNEKDTVLLNTVFCALFSNITSRNS
jgi:hypothetical protein